MPTDNSAKLAKIVYS